MFVSRERFNFGIFGINIKHSEFLFSGGNLKHSVLLDFPNAAFDSTQKQKRHKTKSTILMQSFSEFLSFH